MSCENDNFCLCWILKYQNWGIEQQSFYSVILLFGLYSTRYPRLSGISRMKGIERKCSKNSQHYTFATEKIPVIKTCNIVQRGWHTKHWAGKVCRTNNYWLWPFYFMFSIGAVNGWLFCMCLVICSFSELAHTLALRSRQNTVMLFSYWLPWG